MQLQNGKRFFTNCIFNKGLISKTYKEVKDLDIQKANNPIENVGSELNHSQKVKHKCLRST